MAASVVAVAAAIVTIAVDVATVGRAAVGSTVTIVDRAVAGSIVTVGRAALSGQRSARTHRRPNRHQPRSQPPSKALTSRVSAPRLHTGAGSCRSRETCRGVSWACSPKRPSGAGYTAC